MMYYKMIGDRQVFSTCKSIQLENDYPELGLYAGYYVSNPSDELIAAEGWIEYIPPVIPPQPQTEPEMGVIIEAVKKMLDADTEALSDEDALDVAALFPTWASKLGQQVNVGERLWYDGKLYRVIQAHTTQSDWTPDTVPGLYTEISIVEWPEWVQPISAETAYNTGDKVTFEGTHYVSLIDNNTWSPAEYPAGWEVRP